MNIEGAVQIAVLEAALRKEIVDQVCAVLDRARYSGGTVLEVIELIRAEVKALEKTP